MPNLPSFFHEHLPTRFVGVESTLTARDESESLRRSVSSAARFALAHRRSFPEQGSVPTVAVARSCDASAVASETFPATDASRCSCHKGSWAAASAAAAPLPFVAVLDSRKCDDNVFGERLFGRRSFRFRSAHCRDYGRGLQTACRSKHRPEHLRVSRPSPGGPANANSLVAWEPAVRVVDRVCFSEPSAVQNQRVDWSDLPPIVFLTSCQKRSAFSCRISALA